MDGEFASVTQCSRRTCAAVGLASVLLGFLAGFGCTTSGTRGKATSASVRDGAPVASEKAPTPGRRPPGSHAEVEEDRGTVGPEKVFGSFNEFREYADRVIVVGMSEDQVLAALGQPEDRLEFPQWDSHQSSILMYGYYWVHLTDGKVVATEVHFGF